MVPAASSSSSSMSVRDMDRRVSFSTPDDECLLDRQKRLKTIRFKKLSFKRNNKKGFEPNERKKPQRAWNEITDGLTFARWQGLSTYIHTFHISRPPVRYSRRYIKGVKKGHSETCLVDSPENKGGQGVAKGWKRLCDRSRGLPSCATSLVCFLRPPSPHISVSFSTQNPE